MTNRFWPPLQQHITLTWLWGGQTFTLSDDQAARYEQDPGAVVAELLQCSLETYFTWLEWSGRALCVATSASTRQRCRSTVSGLSFSEPKEFAAYGGGYCATHDPR